MVSRGSDVLVINSVDCGTHPEVAPSQDSSDPLTMERPQSGAQWELLQISSTKQTSPKRRRLGNGEG